MLTSHPTLERAVTVEPSAYVESLPAVEPTCRKPGGPSRALGGVECEADEKQPEGTDSGKWGSKVKWALSQEYDVQAPEFVEGAISSADVEFSERLQGRGLSHKHLSKTGAGPDAE